MHYLNKLTRDTSYNSMSRNWKNIMQIMFSNFAFMKMVLIYLKFRYLKTPKKLFD